MCGQVVGPGRGLARGGGAVLVQHVQGPELPDVPHAHLRAHKHGGVGSTCQQHTSSVKPITPELRSTPSGVALICHGPPPAPQYASPVTRPPTLSSLQECTAHVIKHTGPPSGWPLTVPSLLHCPRHKAPELCAPGHTHPQTRARARSSGTRPRTKWGACRGSRVCDCVCVCVCV